MFFYLVSNKLRSFQRVYLFRSLEWCSPPFPWILKLFHVWFKSRWFKPPWSLRKTKFNVRIINYLANRFFAYLLTWSYQSKLEWPSNCWFFGCQFFFIVPLIIYFWFNMLIISNSNQIICQLNWAIFCLIVEQPKISNKTVRDLALFKSIIWSFSKRTIE